MVIPFNGNTVAPGIVCAQGIIVISFFANEPFPINMSDEKKIISQGAQNTMEGFIARDVVEPSRKRLESAGNESLKFGAFINKNVRKKSDLVRLLLIKKLQL